MEAPLPPFSDSPVLWDRGRTFGGSVGGESSHFRDRSPPLARRTQNKLKALDSHLGMIS